jgi:hypothetical protein
LYFVVHGVLYRQVHILPLFREFGLFINMDPETRFGIAGDKTPRLVAGILAWATATFILAVFLGRPQAPIDTHANHT